MADWFYDQDNAGNAAPKKGIPKLRELISARKAQGESHSGWTDDKSQVFERGFSARLVGDKPKTVREAHAAIRERDDAKATLSNRLVIDVLSIRVRAIDHKRRGKLVESWISGRLLERIITRHKPTREGVDHNRYAITMTYLCGEGIAEPMPNGASGYVWASEFVGMDARARWLVEALRKGGAIKRLEGRRFERVDG